MILKHTLICTKRIVPRLFSYPLRSAQTGPNVSVNNEFEPVFTLPHIRYIAIFNRLKVYTGVGTLMSAPTFAVLESLSIMPQHSIFVSLYVGVTSTALLSLVSMFTRNIIGFLYISTDDEFLKISMVDYWGLRHDKIVAVQDWVPLSSLPARNSDPFYLCPEVDSDKTPMKLIVKMGKVLNKQKVAYLLE